MPRESVLSISDKESIDIERLIFHIILTDETRPIFLEKLEITKEQKKFFKDRLSDSAQGRQYIFTDDNPPIKQLAEKIFVASDDDFLKITKEITNLFYVAHRKTSSDGVFIISIATIKKRKLLFLIKLDHKKVFEYKLKGTKALLEEVKNTFSEDKTAIQKVALIDIDSSVVWDALVFDRSKPGGITEFFAKFLSVIPRETEADLTRKLQNAARTWAATNKQDINPNQEPAVYKNRARSYLSSTDLFDTDAYIDFVVQDEDSSRRERLKNSLRSYLEEIGLAGQSFIPKREALTPKEIKNIRQTAEGVRIEWTGNPQDNNIDIPNNPNQNGDYVIKITTSDISEIQ